jgi:hypothetical protein
MKSEILLDQPARSARAPRTGLRRALTLTVHH